MTYSNRGAKVWDYEVERKVFEASSTNGVHGTEQLVKHTKEIYKDFSRTTAGGVEGASRLLSLTEGFQIYKSTGISEFCLSLYRKKT